MEQLLFGKRKTFEVFFGIIRYSVPNRVFEGYGFDRSHVDSGKFDASLDRRVFSEQEFFFLEGDFRDDFCHMPGVKGERMLGKYGTDGGVGTERIGADCSTICGKMRKILTIRIANSQNPPTIRSYL